MLFCGYNSSNLCSTFKLGEITQSQWLKIALYLFKSLLGQHFNGLFRLRVIHCVLVVGGERSLSQTCSRIEMKILNENFRFQFRHTLIHFSNLNVWYHKQN